MRTTDQHIKLLSKSLTAAQQDGSVRFDGEYCMELIQQLRKLKFVKRCVTDLEAEIERLKSYISAKESVGTDDELLEESLRLIVNAADMLGWSLYLHDTPEGICDGFVIGHPKYVGRAIEALDVTEAPDSDEEEDKWGKK